MEKTDTTEREPHAPFYPKRPSEVIAGEFLLVPIEASSNDTNPIGICLAKPLIVWFQTSL